MILTPQTYVPWNKEATWWLPVWYVSATGTLVCGKLYGRLAGVLTTGKPHNLLPTGVGAWGTSFVTGSERQALWAGLLRAILCEDGQDRRYLTTHLLNPHRLIWYRIMEISCVDCEQNNDSDELAIIIRKTHYTEVCGDNPLREFNSREKMEIKFG